MVSLDDAVIARLDIEGECFEILIDPDAAQRFKEGEDVPLLDHLAIDTVFKDSKKGEKASEAKIDKIFSTRELLKIVERIIREGDIQLTTEQRKQMQEKKRKQIVASIARNSINPQTKTPHPPQRIELAMKEAKVLIDPFKSVELQVPLVLEKLRPIIPIRFEKIKVAVKLAGVNYGKTYGEISKFGNILKDEWQSDGSWIGVVEIPAGLQTEFFDLLNKKTKGEVETKIIK